jgi:hypothetical protein
MSTDDSSVPRPPALIAEYLDPPRNSAPVVKIYVRKIGGPRTPMDLALAAAAFADADDDARRVSFRLPESENGPSIDLLDILELGYAIDGNQAMLEVRAYRDGDTYVSMPEALRTKQIALVKLLRDKGFRTEFA